MVIDNLIVLDHHYGQAYVVQAVTEGFNVFLKGRFGALLTGKQPQSNGSEQECFFHINNRTFLQESQS